MLPPLWGIRWRWMSHHLLGGALPGYVALDVCYRSWLKLGFPAGQQICACSHFPCGNIAACWQIVVFAAPKLAGVWHLEQRQKPSLWLTKKWSLWSEPFGYCRLPKWVDVAAKFLLAQPHLEVVAVGGGYYDLFSSYFSYASFKTISGLKVIK